jgi:hypothetical protein
MSIASDRWHTEVLSPRLTAARDWCEKYNRDHGFLSLPTGFVMSVTAPGGNRAARRQKAAIERSAEWRDEQWRKKLAKEREARKLAYVESPQ